MKTDLLHCTRGFSRRFGVFLFPLWLAMVPLARAALLEELPIELDWPWPTRNGRPLSGDGTTVVGRGEDGQQYLWTRSSGEIVVPIPSGADEWAYSNHLSFDGRVVTGDGLDSGNDEAWTWRRGTGFKVYSSNNVWIDLMNLGVAPDGSSIVRLVENILAQKSTIHRDYSSGFSKVWVELDERDDRNAPLFVSGDSNVLIGVAKPPGSNAVLPAYWGLSGIVTYGTVFSGQICNPTLSNKNGQIIAGFVTTTLVLPDQAVQVSKTFLWNTATNHVDFFLPDGFLETEPSFVSSDGKILQLWGIKTDGSISQSLIWDTTSTAEANKGLQDCTTWLVEHGYLAGADVQGRHNFSIFAISDDGQTVVGDFYNSSNKVHYFYARRLQVGLPPPIGINP